MDSGMSEVSLKITDVGANGDGIARLENGEVVFVPFSTAGDIVMAKVTKDPDRQNRGKILSILLKSPDRATPPCRHFGICGGCALQHLNDNAYHNFKKNQIVAAFEKFDVELPDDFQAVFLPSHTRRRANFAAQVNKGRAIVGFHERRSSNIRDVPDCLLITEPLRAAMLAFKDYLPRLIDDGKKMDVLIQCVDDQIEICLTGTLGKAKQSPLDMHEALAECMSKLNLARLSIRARDYEQYETLLEARPFLKSFGDLIVNLAPGSFLQPSDAGEQTLSSLVIDAVKDAKSIADLFCGNGTFTGPLMKGRDMLAVDLAPDAIASLQRAGVRAEVRNLFKDPLPESAFTAVQAVILDPPRAGAAAQVSILANTDVPVIAYVSCAPQSFAKDAAVLVNEGYRLEKLTLVDQFIWSAHTELVGIFKRTAF